MKQKFAVDIIKNWPRDQVVKDLKFLLEKYFSNRTLGLRVISEKTNISKKTLLRILGQDTKPNQQSVMRFYEYYFQVVEDEALSMQHRWIKEYFLSVLNKHYGSVDGYLEKKLESDLIFRKLYIRLSMFEISKSEVQKKFGDYGIEVISEMQKMRVVESTDDRVFRLRPEASISKSPSALKKMIIELNQDFLSQDSLSEVNKNSAFYFCENISESAYQTILEASEELKKTIRKILSSSDSRGDVPFFITTTIDEMEI
jgi:hypothetical protein